jgi:hypothetical protein
MAVPLIYLSCLNEEASDAAVSDFIDCTRKKEENERQRQEWIESINREKEEKERLGESYEQTDHRDWPEVEEKDII